MAYTNPLHPPVHPTAHSQFSTISGALQPQYLSVTRQHIPQQPYYSSKPGSGRVHAPIAFDHPGYAKQGVQMRELTMRSIGALASVIQNAGDAVLAHTGLSRITLRIMWPGYEHLDFASTIELNIGGYGPITRAQLGAVISQNFARFIDRATTEPSRSAQWTLGSSGIRFEHLVLVSLINVSEDVWQADVAADVR